jgi:hypothetical protein
MDFSKPSLRLLTDIMPPFLFRRLVNMRAWMLYAKFGNKNRLRANRTLRDSRKGRRAFLLATGPSLKLENLKLLEGEDCYSVSNFFLHEDVELLKPRYHFFAPYHKPLEVDNFVEWLRQCDQALPPETGIAMCHADSWMVKKHGLFTERDVRYMFLQGMFAGRYDLERVVMKPQTGPIMMLPFLLYMGYSEIYLLGCDHTILRDYGGITENFYDKNEDVRENATNTSDWIGIEPLLNSQLNVFAQYEYYRRAADSKGVRIVNLSRDSWLPVFERATLDRVLGDRREEQA